MAWANMAITEEINIEGQTAESGRKRRRVPRRVFVRQIGIMLKGQYYIGNSWEIGEGGMLIGSNIPMYENQLVLLTFLLLDSKYVVVRGVVRYCHPQGKKFGIEFQNLDFQMKRRIRIYVASKMAAETENP